MLPDFAEGFEKEGYAVLVYDNRNWGESDGVPRNEVDPFRQSRDYFHAFDYAASLEEVDETKIVYWGTSMSGGTALHAASIDKRIKGVIAHVPFVTGEYMDEQRRRILSNLFANQRDIKEGATPVMFPVIPDSLEQAQQGASQAVLGQPDVFVLLDELERRGIIPFSKEVTFQSLLNLFNFEPRAFIHRIAPTPLLMVVADNDLTVPTLSQLEGFSLGLEPKKLAIVKDSGHFDLYVGKKFQESIAIQLQFLKEIFA